MPKCTYINRILNILPVAALCQLVFTEFCSFNENLEPGFLTIPTSVFNILENKVIIQMRFSLIFTMIKTMVLCMPKHFTNAKRINEVNT